MFGMCFLLPTWSWTLSRPRRSMSVSGRASPPTHLSQFMTRQCILSPAPNLGGAYNQHNVLVTSHWSLYEEGLAMHALPSPDEIRRDLFTYSFYFNSTQVSNNNEKNFMPGQTLYFCLSSITEGAPRGQGCCLFCSTRNSKTQKTLPFLHDCAWWLRRTYFAFVGGPVNLKISNNKRNNNDAR